MLKSVEIKNFRSHRNTIINFHSGFNVITGSSDNGKSAIIWAFIWAMFNRPSGDSIKSWAASTDDPVEVAMEFDTDWFIKKREGTKNIYECSDNDGNLIHYEALRGSVPEVIQQIVNITDYNIQTQAKPYFMLQDSPGDRAKKLNELVGLDIIDSVSKILNGKISVAKTDIVKLNKSIASLSEELKAYEYLPSVEGKIKKLCSTINEQKEVNLRLNLLVSLRDSLMQIDAEIAKQKRILSLEEKYLELKEKVTKWEETKTKLATLTNLKNNLVTINESIELEKEWLSIEPHYLILKNKLIKWEETKTGINNLKKTKDSIVSLDSEIKTKKDYLLNTIIEKYIQTLRSAKTCPYCDNSIQEKSIESIKNKLIGSENI
jgi:exonuclease SbcC